jgi:hypothetical protein
MGCIAKSVARNSRRLFYSVLVLCSLLIASSGWTGLSPDLPGLYVLLKPNQFFEPKTNEMATAEGISLRTSWKDLQPREDGYNLSYLDQTIGTAKAAGKKVMVRVLPGIHSPDWALAGVSSIRYTVHKAGHPLQGQTVTIPVPWDAVYLGRWTAFVSVLGQRYRNDPSLVLIQMAGPTANTAEMHLPKSPEDKALWDKKGYHRDKLVAAWKTVIDAYAKAFPDQYLAVDISIPLYNDGSLEEILSYGARTYPGRFCIQGNWLSDHTREGFPLYRLIKDYSKTTPVGFQMLGPTRPDSAGALREAIDRGIEAGARYLEVYESDFQNPERSDDLRYAAKRLARHE